MNIVDITLNVILDYSAEYLKTLIPILNMLNVVDYLMNLKFANLDPIYLNANQDINA